MACGTAPVASNGGSNDAGNPPASCVLAGGTTSNLNGVEIFFPDQPCVYTLAQAAAGITLKYELHVAQDTLEVHSRRPSPESCDAQTPAGVDLSERITGEHDGYCPGCDCGLGDGRQPPAITLKRGAEARTFHWDGRNWGGPSDTGNREGPAFPPGVYTFTVRTTGTAPTSAGTGLEVDPLDGQPWREFVVEGHMQITLVP